MLGGDTRSGHGVEAVGLQLVAQLHQGVVIAPVAEHRHGDGQSPIALKTALHKGQQLVGDAACVSRRAEDHQVAGAIAPGLLSSLGQGKIVIGHGDAQRCPHSVGHGTDHLFGIARGAEKHGVYFRYLHCSRSSIFLRMNFCARQVSTIK